jgi:hypothetical protein
VKPDNAEAAAVAYQFHEINKARARDMLVKKIGRVRRKGLSGGWDQARLTCRPRRFGARSEQVPRLARPLM